MRRREFIAGVGSAAAWPLVARAQQKAMPVIGFLHGATLAAISLNRFSSFQRGLAEMGYVEGRNLAIEYRWAEGQNDRLPALATDLVRRKVGVIVAPGSTTAALVAKAATQSTPIVFMIGADPVELGLVASLSRPGGNLTGVSVVNGPVVAKCLEFLHELVPTATSIAVLFNPTNPAFAKIETRELQFAARTLGVRLLFLEAREQSEFEGAFATLVGQKAGALLVSGDGLFVGRNQVEQLVALAARHAVPAIYQYREQTLAGGLASYGASLSEAYHQVGVYTGRILKGAAPSDLPVTQSTKLEFVINLKTAKALGLTFREMLVARADEVIQ
jgi:putative tryptophan/tyrosine transport system substrate-binding protein